VNLHHALLVGAVLAAVGAVASAWLLGVRRRAARQARPLAVGDAVADLG
jgi:hypothetical protein